MNKHAAKLDKRELLLVIGKLSGEIERTVDALEKVLPLLQSLYFHTMCVAQIKEARKTWEKLIRFIWLAANWKLHSMPEIEEEISEISVLKFLEVIYLFEQEVDQGIKDLESTAEWLIENDNNDIKYPLAGDEILKSMRAAIFKNNQDEPTDYLSYTEMTGYSSEALKIAYECLTQANESENNLREFIYFIELAIKIENADIELQPPSPKTELPLFKFCPAS
ncbi:MAG: hypothetical protein ACD_7C00492G0013 [uncultured bacterium]|nr:MAG: hypothetical protein ACD_7C00492G0013 [uncultured bacterium]HBR79345.1 hypothetical protein [Candidatus Moranbacteria bacterium]